MIVTKRLQPQTRRTPEPSRVPRFSRDLAGFESAAVQALAVTKLGELVGADARSLVVGGLKPLTIM